MTKKILILLAVAVFSAGCATKLEKARTNISRTWQISKVYENGQDVTAVFLLGFGQYRIHFDNGGDFVENYYPFSGADQLTVTGTWVFSDGINKITLTDNNQTRVYQVDRLDEDHLNVTDLGSSDNTELHMIPD
ncbi:MAG: DUF5004 domain-containing protein [Flavobacteriales bacterium]|jgi:hypothetical protein|nr:DUF5004 domain-containing protein [Flavobacteriales bacterium]